MVSRVRTACLSNSALAATLSTRRALSRSPDELLQRELEKPSKVGKSGFASSKSSMDARGLVTPMERLWIEEVRHLHSLWREGPPRIRTVNLGPRSSVAFKPEHEQKKRQEKKARRKRKKDLASQETIHNHPVSTVSDVEWPVNPEPAEPKETGWQWPSPTQKPQDAPAQPPTAEELATLSAIQMQKHAVELCRVFFQKDHSDGEDDEEEPLDEDDGSVRENLEFFLRFFEENADLRGYYEKKWEQGEFSCLVCGGMGVKLRKKFSNCVALVQHSVSISKTKKRAAHRAFGQAVSRVLGWEINRLPTIVLSLDKPLGHKLQPDAAENASIAQDIPVSENTSAAKDIPVSAASDVIHIDSSEEE
ncbi:hypothetical protein H6P81_014019 [Aristolochia fimbriata]|uniref:Uncharacterized protein n=1 Tax=Aristolochia fimbriata TaxID=158543 RepID=A0AAV7EHI2_ARIFI|nr:hypothetical protein H6P81_014019 [Aristolochia fimbriata]